MKSVGVGQQSVSASKSMVWALQTDEEAEAIRALATDSDRAAAIVAASLVEIRLEQAIRNAFMNRDEDVEGKMFHSTAPLGSFAAKIRLAYLMGLASRDFHDDLENMKEIRNRFAHRLSALSFNEPSIRDRAKNFRIVDHVATEYGENEAWEKEAKYGMRLAVKHCSAALADPRQRYLISAQIFAMGLHPWTSRDGKQRVRPNL